MRDRISILREIMEIEKQYALEEIDANVFENRMQVLEQQLHATTSLSDDEFKKAVNSRQIPLSADRLVGKISIEDLLPTFNVPRTFYRHMKIRREILELERNIQDLLYNLQKIRILQAEKKINPEASAVKVETLEFDLRLAKNRLGAREKYLKRNPTKGELIKFTLQNYLKFSFGHGISTEEELKQLTSDLNNELVLRKEYRNALAEMLATMKTSQLDISTTKKSNGLPDFKQLINYQQMINELQDYISLLTSDLREYTNCLSLLQQDNLKIDETHDLFVPDKFGIDVGTEEIPQPPKPQEDDKKIPDTPQKVTDPLLQTISVNEERIDPVSLFLIDTTDSISGIEVEDVSLQPEDLDKELVIPDTPQPLYEPSLELEIIGGMEDFNQPFKINGSTQAVSKSTQKIIFQSFEGLLEKLIDNNEISIKQEPKPVTKTKLKITKLSSDIKEAQKITSECEETNIETLLGFDEENSLNDLTNDLIVEDKPEITEAEAEAIREIEAPIHEELPPPPPVDEKKLPLPPPPDDKTLPPPPPPPAPEGQSTIEAEKHPIDKIEKTITELEPLKEAVKPKKPEITHKEILEDANKPTKKTMISQKLLQAATEAWKLTGKGIFDILEDSKRDFIGYIQEVVVYDKSKLGFILVSEAEANQVIIDKIFDQIKPLWVTEELLESTERRRNYVINEVMESLQAPRDVALHITRLQEFANFRNIDYPADEKTSPPKAFGIVPIDKLRIKRGSLICSRNQVLPLKPYRTAPWSSDKISDDKSPVGKYCYQSEGQKIGKIISIVQHPLLGKILLVDTEVPDRSLIDYLVNRLEIKEPDQKEQVWLVKYLIAKQLRIPEGDVLKAKTLINYSLKRGFPILPNEILNSFRIFVSGGSIDKNTKRKVILKNSARIFHPSEVFPLECLRVRSINGRHLGTCLGLSLSDNPVMLISERLSRDIIALFTDATVEKEIMNDISRSVTGTIGVAMKDSLCTHNILKTLIVGKKVQTLADYGSFLSKMNVTGIDLSDIQVVEQGTIFIKAYEEIASTNIFEE